MGEGGSVCINYPPPTPPSCKLHYCLSRSQAAKGEETNMITHQLSVDTVKVCGTGGVPEVFPYRSSELEGIMFGIVPREQFFHVTEKSLSQQPKPSKFTPASGNSTYRGYKMFKKTIFCSVYILPR